MVNAVSYLLAAVVVVAGLAVLATVLTLDLQAFSEPQMQHVQRSDSMRSTGKLEGSPKKDQKK